VDPLGPDRGEDDDDGVIEMNWDDFESGVSILTTYYFIMPHRLLFQNFTDKIILIIGIEGNYYQ
jgi:hypothetical protein